jgi:hypothetical protein
MNRASLSLEFQKKNKISQKLKDALFYFKKFTTPHLLLHNVISFVDELVFSLMNWNEICSIKTKAEKCKKLFDSIVHSSWPNGLVEGNYRFFFSNYWDYNKENIINGK